MTNCLSLLPQLCAMIPSRAGWKGIVGLAGFSSNEPKEALRFQVSGHSNKKSKQIISIHYCFLEKLIYHSILYESELKFIEGHFKYSFNQRD